MRSCPKNIHIRMLRGETGHEYNEHKWYHIIQETWFMVTLFIIWSVCLIALAIA